MVETLNLLKEKKKKYVYTIEGNKEERRILVERKEKCKTHLSYHVIIKINKCKPQTNKIIILNKRKKKDLF